MYFVCLFVCLYKFQLTYLMIKEEDGERDEEESWLILFIIYYIVIYNLTWVYCMFMVYFVWLTVETQHKYLLNTPEDLWWNYNNHFYSDAVLMCSINTFNSTSKWTHSEQTCKMITLSWILYIISALRAFFLICFSKKQDFVSTNCSQMYVNICRDRKVY